MPCDYIISDLHVHMQSGAVGCGFCVTQGANFQASIMYFLSALNELILGFSF